MSLVLPISADDNTKADVTEFITRINYGTFIGNFEMDYSDGEIRYRTSFSCGTDEYQPTIEQIDELIWFSIYIIKKYGDGLLKVLFGMVTPEEAIYECEKDDE